MDKQTLIKRLERLSNLEVVAKTSTGLYEICSLDQELDTAKDEEVIVLECEEIELDEDEDEDEDVDEDEYEDDEEGEDDEE